MSSGTYRALALALAAAFAVVGLLFLFTPGGVAALFGSLSPWAALQAGDVEGGLFRVLAAAYMYLVAWLAWTMFKRPDAGRVAGHSRAGEAGQRDVVGRPDSAPGADAVAGGQRRC